MPKRIQMSRQRPWRAEHPDAVRVDRSTKWGNPFRIEKTGPGWEHPLYVDDGVGVPFFDSMADARAYVVDVFESDLARGRLVGYPSLDEIRAELAGKDVACWCPLIDQHGNPVPCHGDVLLEIANASC